MTYDLFSAKTEDTEAIGKAIAKRLHDAGIGRAFLSLYGEMGVGKTAFVRGFASAFEISGVRSPTYTMVNEYRSKKSGVAIYHFDLYRIGSEDDLYSIGFDDYLEKDGFCIAEWSENVEEALPPERICIAVARTQNGADERNITLTIPNGYPVDFSGFPFLKTNAER